MQQVQCLMKSKIGPLYLVATERGLSGIFWKRQAVPLLKTSRANSDQSETLKRAIKELNEYLNGDRKSFDLPLAPVGTAFQRRVWSALSRIPYGQTASYQDIARRIRNPKAVRAVGAANGKNPFCIVVPCHRVIHKDGSLGGYAGGLSIKTRLLALERRASG